MKLLNLSVLAKSVAIVAVVGSAGTAQAGVGGAVEKTGQALTNVGDSIFSGLSGKSVNQADVNHPVSLYDYDQGTSAYEDAYVNGNLNVQDGNQEQTSYDLDLGTDYERVFSSANANTKVEAKANGSVNRGGNKNDKSVENWEIGASATHDRYFNPSANDLFWYGKGSIEAQNEADGSDYAGLDDPLVTVSGGLGYGRVVNVTPMAKAMRVVEALVHNGVLQGVPSKVVYNKIAAIIEKESEYRSKYGADYEQYWVKDVETALGVSLGANGAIRVYDVLTSERISTRKYGWDVRAGAGVVAHDYNGESGNPLVEAEFNYYYPISNRTQFANEAKFYTILDDDSNTYTVTNNMALTYEVSDRVDWINTLSSNYTDNESSNNIFRNSFASTYRYYISNAISADATLKFDSIEDDIDNNGNDKVDSTLLIGVNYRLK